MESSLVPSSTPVSTCSTARCESAPDRLCSSQARVSFCGSDRTTELLAIGNPLERLIVSESDILDGNAPEVTETGGGA